MRTFALIVLGLVAMSADLRALSITAQVTSDGTNSSGAAVYEYTYAITNLTLQTNEELDLFFDPSVYQELSDVKVGSGFEYVLFQPNFSPPAPGDFGVVPITNNTTVTGPFSVSFTLMGQSSPGPQYFTVSEFSPSGGLIGVVASGMTSLQSTVAAPEPAAVSLMGFALLLGTMCCVGRLYADRRVR